MSLIHYVQLACDGMNCSTAYRPTVTEMGSKRRTLAGAVKDGWLVDTRGHFCPECRSVPLVSGTDTQGNPVCPAAEPCDDQHRHECNHHLADHPDTHDCYCGYFWSASDGDLHREGGKR